MEQPVSQPRSVELVAILRGLTPQRAPEVGATLVNVGFRTIEVPLNSPDPFDTIKLLARAHGAQCLVGAGTVLDTTDVERVHDACGQHDSSRENGVAIGEQRPHRGRVLRARRCGREREERQRVGETRTKRSVEARAGHRPSGRSEGESYPGARGDATTMQSVCHRRRMGVSYLRAATPRAFPSDQAA